MRGECNRTVNVDAFGLGLAGGALHKRRRGSDDAILSIGRRLGASRLVHAPAPTAGSAEERNRRDWECLVLGWDPYPGILRDSTRTTLSSELPEEFREIDVSIDMKTDASDSQGSTDSRLPSDPGDHREKGSSPRVLPRGAIDARCVRDPATDDKTSVVGEVTFYRHGEVRLPADVGHSRSSRPEMSLSPPEKQTCEAQTMPATEGVSARACPLDHFRTRPPKSGSCGRTPSRRFQRRSGGRAAIRVVVLSHREDLGGYEIPAAQPSPVYSVRHESAEDQRMRDPPE